MNILGAIILSLFWIFLASLGPEGLLRMVRDIEKIMGDGKKWIWDSEKPAMKKLRENLV